MNENDFIDIVSLELAKPPSLVVAKVVVGYASLLPSTGTDVRLRYRCEACTANTLADVRQDRRTLKLH